MRNRIGMMAVILNLLISVGCTHIQLRRNTINQTRTLTDIINQQVVDNLAMFTANPDALPYFAVPGSATATVNDQASGNVNLVWNNTSIMSELLGIGGSRTMTENWTLAPVTNPDQLALMRCAYQTATGYIAVRDDECPSCCKALRAWYPDSQVQGADPPCHHECILGPGWYGVGCKNDVPDCACYVSHYCDTYVWVTPEGTEGLTRLTMAILNYATGTAPTKSVVRRWTPDVVQPGTGDVVSYKLDYVQTTLIEPNGENRVVMRGTKPLPETGPQADSGPTSPGAVIPRQNFFDPNRGLFFLPRP